jgi:multicomponent Na+:H+ antiporter subunit B
VSAPVRTAFAFAALLGVGAFALWGVAGLAPFGHYPGPYGDVVNALATRQRHVLNAVTAVNFDYRALDTLVEEYIFFAAVTGLSALARRQVGEDEHRTSEPREKPPRGRVDGVVWLCYGLLPLTLAFGFYMAIHAVLTPGGGFQGGAIAGSAFALAYLALGYEAYKRLAPPSLEAFGAFGAAGYVLTGAATAVASGAFLVNVLALGSRGQLLSGGTIWVINACVFVEVACGFAVMLGEFLDLTRRTAPS